MQSALKFASFSGELRPNMNSFVNMQSVASNTAHHFLTHFCKALDMSTAMVKTNSYGAGKNTH